jgi:hypothetical protein
MASAAAMEGVVNAAPEAVVEEPVKVDAVETAVEAVEAPAPVAAPVVETTPALVPAPAPAVEAAPVAPATRDSQGRFSGKPAEINTVMTRDDLAAALAQVTTQANAQLQEREKSVQALMAQMEQQREELGAFRERATAAAAAEKQRETDALNEQLEVLGKKGFATDGIRRGILEMSKVDANQAQAMIAVCTIRARGAPHFIHGPFRTL